MSDPTASTTPAPDEATGPKELRDFAERQKAEAETARAEADALRTENRRLVFQAAGVDLDSRVGQMFDETYKGDLTVDAVKTDWAEVAPQSAPAATPADDGPTEAELAHQKASAAVTTGGTPPGQEPTPEPWPDALAGFRADRERGIRVETAQKNALQKIIDAAAAGDERVLG